jgi:hypothetical protein
LVWVKLSVQRVAWEVRLEEEAVPQYVAGLDVGDVELESLVVLLYLWV